MRLLGSTRCLQTGEGANGLLCLQNGMSVLSRIRRTATSLGISRNAQSCRIRTLSSETHDRRLPLCGIAPPVASLNLQDRVLTTPRHHITICTAPQFIHIMPFHRLGTNVLKATSECSHSDTFPSGRLGCFISAKAPEMLSHSI